MGNKQDTSLDNSLALKCTLTTYISSRPSKIHLEIVHMEVYINILYVSQTNEIILCIFKDIDILLLRIHCNFWNHQICQKYFGSNLQI